MEVLEEIIEQITARHAGRPAMTPVALQETQAQTGSRGLSSLSPL